MILKKMIIRITEKQRTEMNKKEIAAIIAGTSVLIIGVCKLKRLLYYFGKSKEESEDKIKWLYYELEETEKENNFLREELTGANEEISNLRKKLNESAESV